jgi:hypothetical protein
MVTTHITALSCATQAVKIGVGPDPAISRHSTARRGGHSGVGSQPVMGRSPVDDGVV